MFNSDLFSLNQPLQGIMMIILPEKVYIDKLDLIGISFSFVLLLRHRPILCKGIHRVKISSRCNSSSYDEWPRSNQCSKIPQVITCQGTRNQTENKLRVIVFILHECSIRCIRPDQ